MAREIVKYSLGRYSASGAPANRHSKHIGGDFRRTDIGRNIIHAMFRWFLLLPAEQIPTANLCFQPPNLESSPVHFRLAAYR
jgi:hypothetical protein